MDNDHHDYVSEMTRELWYNVYSDDLQDNSDLLRDTAAGNTVWHNDLFRVLRDDFAIDNSVSVGFGLCMAVIQSTE